MIWGPGLDTALEWLRVPTRNPVNITRNRTEAADLRDEPGRVLGRRCDNFTVLVLRLGNIKRRKHGHDCRPVSSVSVQLVKR
jgi:hypothetical protein